MPKNISYDIVVLGAGAAGIAAVESAATAHPNRSIALLSNEDRLPYKRTKISKSFAKGFEPEQFALLEPSWFKNSGTTFLAGVEVKEVDCQKHRLLLSSGETLGWKKLVLATGARPKVPEAQADVTEALHRANAIADIEGLREAILVSNRGDGALILGDGVLALEVAQEIRTIGLPVTIVGRADKPLHRELDEHASRRLLELCKTNGVSFFLGAEGYRLGRADGGVRIQLPQGASPSGKTVTATIAVLAIGLAPRVDIAQKAGLRVNRGIVVDRYLRTSHPDVYAAGDCAEHPDGRVTHLWRDALRQGEVAGVNIASELSRRADNRGNSDDNSVALRPYNYVPFRLKCELFGSYFFSLCRRDTEASGAFEERIYRSGPQYVHAYFRADDGGLGGVVMIDDKDNQERYTQAVHEGWSRDRFEAAIVAPWSQQRRER